MYVKLILFLPDRISSPRVRSRITELMASVGIPILEMIPIKDLPAYPDEEVNITGWVHNIQRFKKHAFLIIRDPALVQVYVPIDLLPPVTQESYVEITGTVQKLPEGKYSYLPVELHASKVSIRSKASEDFASRCPSDASAHLKLTQRHLYLRDEKFAAVTKLRAMFIRAIHRYFQNQGSTEIFPPSIVGNQCEGGSTLFKIDHVGQPGYLTQSSQFYLEYAVPGLGDCYCISPSFRAEKSHTRRHLTEFLHAECEWKDVRSLEIHVRKLQHMLRGILREFLVLTQPESPTDVDLLEKVGRREKIEEYYEMLCDTLRSYSPECESRCVVMTHKQAIEYCREHDIYKDPETKEHFGDLDDIPEAQERQMIDQIGKIVFLTMFPAVFKSFYMKKDPEDPTYVWGCDVEVPGVGEVVGSGVRENDPEQLLTRLTAEGLDPKEYEEYLDLRRYGFGDTSGMGLGVDRILTWLLGAYSIREVVTFPRYPGNLFP